MSTSWTFDLMIIYEKIYSKGITRSHRNLRKWH